MIVINILMIFVEIQLLITTPEKEDKKIIGFAITEKHQAYRKNAENYKYEVTVSNVCYRLYGIVVKLSYAPGKTINMEPTLQMIFERVRNG